MSEWVVADSGIYIASALTEPLSAAAKSVFLGWQHAGNNLAAPFLLHYEIVAVTRKSVHRGRLSREQAVATRDKLLNMPVTLFTDSALLVRAFELAEMLNQPTAYDAQYLAVAEHLGCELWTADERFYNSVHGSLPWVKWLGQHTP